jgi:hypothetical protein
LDDGRDRGEGEIAGERVIWRIGGSSQHLTVAGATIVEEGTASYRNGRAVVVHAPGAGGPVRWRLEYV